MCCGVGHRRGLDPTLLWLWHSLGTSICHRCGPKKKKKEGRKGERERKRERERERERKLELPGAGLLHIPIGLGLSSQVPGGLLLAQCHHYCHHPPLHVFDISGC